MSSPAYKKTVIDYLVSRGLLDKLDATSFSGWEYIVRPTYEGELTALETYEGATEMENRIGTGRKTIEQMLEEDIKRCETFLNQPKDEAFGKKLYIEITSRYDSVIPSLGNGLCQ